MILVTGSRGLLGRSLVESLRRRGQEILEFDIRDDPPLDVRDSSLLGPAVQRCHGIVHLAAVSRVIWGERDPAACEATNVGGTRNVIRAAFDGQRRPWLVFASSREVYGQPDRLPADESTPLAPVNAYGQTKVEAERMLESAASDGLRVAIARLSNVYGRIDDHRDRVVPAFARAAATGAAMRVDGPDNVFDFTHVEDTVRGLIAMIDTLETGEPGLPPIHLLTGTPTTLEQLANLANLAGGQRATIHDAPARDYDVARFYGDPSRARTLLGWSATIDVEHGVRRLVEDFRREETP